MSPTFRARSAPAAAPAASPRPALACRPGSASPPPAWCAHPTTPKRRAQVRIARIRTVLATRTCTDTLGGLPGLLLTVGSVGPGEANGGGLLDAEPLAAQLIGGHFVCARVW